jgi:hypothetical protein
MNKPLALCVMLLAAIVPHAANGGNVEENVVISQPKMADQANISETVKVNEVTVTCIRDNKAERTMPLSLFGDIPESLIDSLGIRNGIKSSVNAILVKTEEATILFDTGLGKSDSQLLMALSNKPGHKVHLSHTLSRRSYRRHDEGRQACVHQCRSLCFT